MIETTRVKEIAGGKAVVVRHRIEHRSSDSPDNSIDHVGQSFAVELRSTRLTWKARDGKAEWDSAEEAEAAFLADGNSN